MEINVVRIDSTDVGFTNEFKEYKARFLSILSVSFDQYYGDEYQLKRIIDGKAIVYIAMTNGEVVGASYVKRNLRRGGTAVDPQHRCKGIAGCLVSESLKDFPIQYSILRANNTAMISLLSRFDFVKPRSVDEIRKVVRDEFSQLSDIVFRDSYVVFKRMSSRRQAQRELLTLMHNFAIE